MSGLAKGERVAEKFPMEQPGMAGAALLKTLFRVTMTQIALIVGTSGLNNTCLWRMG